MTDHQNCSADIEGLSFQKRVVNWLMACFSMEVCRDGTERNHRFLEESLELVQSLGCTASEAHQLVDYVFGRPVGEPDQELGGVQVTLAALCFPHDLDMEAARERELARVWTKIDKIRAKQAAKPKHSPLPEHVPVAAQPTGTRKALEDCLGCVVAAEAEGLHEVISELRSTTDDETVNRLIDLVERRLMWVREYAEPALAAPGDEPLSMSMFASRADFESAIAAQPPASPVKQDSIGAIISGIGASDTPAGQALEIVHKLGRAGYAIVKYGDVPAAPVETKPDWCEIGDDGWLTLKHSPAAAPVETLYRRVELGDGHVSYEAVQRSSAATEVAVDELAEFLCDEYEGEIGSFCNFNIRIKDKWRDLVRALLARVPAQPQPSPASAPLTAKDVLAAVEWKNTTVNAGLVSAILQKFDVRSK